jgi:putative transposase
MGIARSSYCRDNRTVLDDTALVERMHSLAEEWPRYGYRRMAAQLRAEGLPMNRKRVARLMRLHGLCVRSRRRYVVTTDSNHAGPIFPNLARTVVPDGPDQLWVADITYIGLTSGSFVYLAVILDAWSRRVIDYVLTRLIDAKLTVAALQAAIVTRRPPHGCVHHSDRGGQYAAERYRTLLIEQGLIDSMGRRGNPYDNAKAESFMKTSKVEAVYQTEYASFEEVAVDLPHFLEGIYNERRLHSAFGYRSPAEFERQHAQEGVKAPA